MFQIIKEHPSPRCYQATKLAVTIIVKNIIRALMYAYRIFLWSNVKRSHPSTLNTYPKLSNKINFKQRNGKLKLKSNVFQELRFSAYRIVLVLHYRRV